MNWQATLTQGVKSGLKVIWELGKVIVPAVMVVTVLEQTGGLEVLSRWLGPLMSIFGLPGETALVLVTANFVSFYGGLGMMVALGLTVKQLTILSAMIMICHAIITETALVVKAGASGSWVVATRIAVMILVGLVLNWVLPT